LLSGYAETYNHQNDSSSQSSPDHPGWEIANFLHENADIAYTSATIYKNVSTTVNKTN
jgi:hypothetical protein